MLNKKGTFFDDLPGIIATIIFIIIIIFLFSTYQIKRESVKFESIDIIKRNTEADEKMLLFLQKNIDFDINNDGIEEKTTITNLIIFSFLNDNYDNLKEETKKIMTELRRNERSGLKIKMYKMPEDKKKVEVETDTSGKSRSSSIFFLPLLKDDEYIKIELYESVSI